MAGRTTVTTAINAIKGYTLILKFTPPASIVTAMQASKINFRIKGTAAPIGFNA